jgi:hypothetical protein
VDVQAARLRGNIRTWLWRDIIDTVFALSAKTCETILVDQDLLNSEPQLVA